MNCLAPKYTDPRLLFALCVWREARGACIDAKRGVAHVVLNRVNSPRFPGSLQDVILQRFQFSSFNTNDPNSSKYPDDATGSDARAWEDCLAIVDDPGNDPTGGAVYYHSDRRLIGTTPWFQPANQTAVILPFWFYREPTIRKRAA